MTTASSTTAPTHLFSGIGTGQWLMAWLAIAVALQGLNWLTGQRSFDLAVAVEQGAARTEQSLRGEISDADALKAIRLQTETLTFWAVLTLLYDLGLEPIWIVMRPFLAAVVVGAAAAMTGREPPFSNAFQRFARLQFFWLLGPALAGLLSSLLGYPAEASLRLLLPPGEYHALAWIMLGKLDCFALVGWLALAITNWRAKWSPSWLAIPGLFGLWLTELVSRTVFETILETGMRLTIIPS